MTRHILSGTNPSPAESTNAVRARVIAAYERQLARTGKANHLLSNHEVDACCQLSREQRQLLETIINRYNLSARALHRILKVARTIADMEAATDIQTPHLQEAINYRRLDRLQHMLN